MQKPILAAFLSLSGTSLTDEEKYLFEKYNPLGLTLFNRNLSDKKQITNLVKEIKETIGRDDVLIAIDQEGGRVNRLKAAGFGEYAPQKVLGKINSDEITALHCRLIAEDMHSIDVNLNFAPVLDIEYPHTSTVLHGRCFGSDEKQITKHGKIMCNTYIDEGICPCIKHLPGHGHASSDPHLGLPIISKSVRELAKDFYPFQQLKNCPAAMTAHILIPEIDDKNPITLSARGIDEIIRKQIGFEGLLISDSIDMDALKGTKTERSIAAWNAGCDAVCYCFGRYDEMEDICQHGKYLQDNALFRFNTIKNVLHNKKKAIKLDNERKKYYSLVNQFADEKINYDATEVLHLMQKGEK